jgi:hypothetical protein
MMMQDPDIAWLETIPGFWDISLDEEDEEPSATPPKSMGSSLQSYSLDLLNTTSRENNA